MREKALQVVMVLVGLLFTAAIYPAVTAIWYWDHTDTGDTMMMSIYFVLGVFLLLAVRKPAEHRSLIGFAAWSSFAHAISMGSLGLQIPAERQGFLTASAILVVIGVALIALAPRKQPLAGPAAGVSSAGSASV